MISLTPKELKGFIDYINATGYTFEVEESNDKYKNLVKSIDGSFVQNDHYYEMTQKQKWGCECRLYLYNFENFPKAIRQKIVSSYGYGGAKGGRNGKYTIRINDTDFLRDLVENYDLRVGEY